ncbi:MAG TPA: VWA domain-containing protein, partial [Phototrophicaceae bacterium]|nr:VWA domain-containing protein [Phototrophicaceae bacterium]
MSFTTPLALLLLICIPAIIFVGFPRQRFRRSRDLTSLTLRVAMVTLLVLALAGVQIVRSAERLAVIFLVDTSDSVGVDGVETAVNYVRESIKRMGTDDESGVILFGGDAQVERAVNNVRELGTLRTVPDSGNTNLAGAIRLALALFPADAARRIVILSDGIPTLGNTEAAAELARASGVQISYVPVERQPSPEVRVTEFTAPASVQEGQQFDLSIGIESDIDTQAQIVIFAGGKEIIRQDVPLRKGANNRTLTLQATEAGFRDFQIVVEPVGGDGFYQNNSLSTFSQVVGPSRVLLVGVNPEDTQYIIPALQEAGLIVDSIAPNELPTSVAGLAQYKSVILVNVPGPQLSTRRMQVLQTYVRDLGGGLVVVGGRDTYGPGGYFKTALEDTLPVEMQIKDQQRLPQLTIAYVIDRSGSMGSVGPDGVPMIELAKEAINRSIDLLQPTDRAAVATFDAVAYWIAQFQEVMDRQQLQRLVGTLTPSGGTDILAGMQLVASEIINEPSKLKHIILLTDGIANPAGLIPLTEELYQKYQVTTTTIAIGASSPLLEQMAKAGGGNYHIATDISTIPTIFAQETVLATRSYIFEEDFVPNLTARSPIMDGIDGLPELRGYVSTTAKTAAQVILRSSNQFHDPILASWQYGLGRSV